MRVSLLVCHVRAHGAADPILHVPFRTGASRPGNSAPLPLCMYSKSQHRRLCVLILGLGLQLLVRLPAAIYLTTNSRKFFLIVAGFSSTDLGGPE